jgi:hypothetical protein
MSSPLGPMQSSSAKPGFLGLVGYCSRRTRVGPGLRSVEIRFDWFELLAVSLILEIGLEVKSAHLYTDGVCIRFD